MGPCSRWGGAPRLPRRHSCPSCPCRGHWRGKECPHSLPEAGLKGQGPGVVTWCTGAGRGSCGRRGTPGRGVWPPRCLSSVRAIHPSVSARTPRAVPRLLLSQSHGSAKGQTGSSAGCQEGRGSAASPRGHRSEGKQRPLLSCSVTDECVWCCGQGSPCPRHRGDTRSSDGCEPVIRSQTGVALLGGQEGPF